MTLYLILMIASAFIPLVLSFDKKLQFYRRWKYVFPVIIVIAIFFILPDMALTRSGIWGFNPVYHSAMTLVHLPIEELLFFIIIPFSSLFLHYAVMLYFPNLVLQKKTAKLLATIFILFSIIIITFNHDKIYTVYAFLLFIIALVLGIISRQNQLGAFFVTFLIILVPFLVVDGVLTGTFIKEQVVWYNPKAFMGIRFLTIPLEDFLYGFSLIFYNLLLTEKITPVSLRKGLKH